MSQSFTHSVSTFSKRASPIRRRLDDNDPKEEGMHSGSQTRAKKLPMHDDPPMMSLAWKLLWALILLLLLGCSIYPAPQEETLSMDQAAASTRKDAHALRASDRNSNHKDVDDNSEQMKKTNAKIQKKDAGDVLVSYFEKQAEKIPEDDEAAQYRFVAQVFQALGGEDFFPKPDENDPLANDPKKLVEKYTSDAESTMRAQMKQLEEAEHAVNESFKKVKELNKRKEELEKQRDEIIKKALEEQRLKKRLPNEEDSDSGEGKRRVINNEIIETNTNVVVDL